MSYLYTAGATGEEQRGPVELDALVQLAVAGELSWETSRRLSRPTRLAKHRRRRDARRELG